MMMYIQSFVILLCTLNLNKYGLLGQNAPPTSTISTNEIEGGTLTPKPREPEVDQTPSPGSSSSVDPIDGGETSTEGSQTNSTPLDSSTTEGNDASWTKPTTPPAPQPSPGDNGTSWTNNTTTPATITPPPGSNGSSPYFDDISTFIEGFNRWIISGMWGRYNISTKFTIFDIIAPSSPDSDGIIILTMDTGYPFITKQFPALKNGSLYISNFFTCSEASIVGKGFVDNIPEKEIFRIENPMTSKWIAESHLIENEGQPFTINLEYKTQDPKCLWAIDVIRVSGNIIKDPIPVPPSPETTEIPTAMPPIPSTITTTESLSTSTATTQNSTIPVTPSETIPPSTPQPDSTTPTSTTSKTSEPTLPPPTTPDSDNIHQETAKEMGRIASTMWTAIYIFLVLFCLCLLVFIFFAVEKWRKEQRGHPERRKDFHSARRTTSNQTPEAALPN